MFFSGKLKEEIAGLNEELQQLRAENEALTSDNHSLSQQLQELNATRNDGDNHQQAICSAWIEGNGLVEDVRDTVAAAADSLDSEKGSLSDSMNIFEETRQAVNTILERVEVIQNRSDAGNNNVQSLLAVSQQIEEFVGVIRGISDQTNLLALNAAIEAARAGDSGRGFAVVADEVRNLAKKAGEASEEIASLVQRIAAQTGEACDDIGQVREMSGEVVASAEQIRAGVAQVVDLSERMNQVISGSSVDAFIETVKLDHVIWKNSVYRAIVSEELDSLTALADHTSCRLGNWYYNGDGRQLYSHLNSFGRLEEPHQLVHRNGLAAVEAMRTGNAPEAARHLSEMEHASGLVSDLLSRLRSELN